MGSLSLSQLPLRNVSPIVLIPFFSLFFSPSFVVLSYVEGFFALFGGLSSSASVQ